MVAPIIGSDPSEVGHGSMRIPRKSSSSCGRGRPSSLIVIAILVFWGSFMVTKNGTLLPRSLDPTGTPYTWANTMSTMPTTTTTTTGAINAATGARFAGTPVRRFDGRLRLDPSPFYLRTKDKQQVAEMLRQFVTNQSLHQKCNQWAVVTTIYQPSESIRLVGNSPELERWCMLVVADTKTPETYLMDAGWNSSHHKVAFLSVQDQLELATIVPFVEQTPFQSFARKNIGYLYAIWMGANVIFDFDDDNLIKTKNATNNTELWSGTELLEQFAGGEQDIMVKQVSMSEEFEGRAFNPFPAMGATVPDAWPRGVPLSLIQSNESRGQPGPLMLKEVKRSKVAVIQSVADHDPDVDAIYRLTRPLPFQFESSKVKAMTVEVPRNHYSPYNAQATLHYSLAFWGLYLPMTVTGRVSDIWRSYIVQRLLRELEEQPHVLYSPPMVVQFRNAHNYIHDFAAEQHLYLRTEALLEFLDEWKPNVDSDSGLEDNLQHRIEDLWIGLYERQFIELEDVEAIQEWLNALEQGGYAFPAVQDHSRFFDVATGGVAARRECARQRLLNWEEPIPTLMNGSNYGALKLHFQPGNGSHHKSVARLLAEYELENPFPHSIDLICRAGGGHNPHELAVMIESVQLYWPRCAGRIVLVLDRDDKEFARENIPSWIDVMYSEFAYGMPGRMGNQLFNMYSDQQGRSEYVAVIDSDTALVTPVTPDLVFNLNKIDESGRAPPIILTDTNWQKGMWSKGDSWMLQGNSNDWNFMVTLPVVFPRAMFPQYRASVEAMHNNEFETTDLWQHFRRSKGNWMAMSQFCLLGNWMVRYWTDAPLKFDLRNETDVPSIRYGVHLPYHSGIDFRPGGQDDPASFQKAGRRVIADGLCELFCSIDPSTTTDRGLSSSRGLDESRVAMPALEVCSSLCPVPIEQPRGTYFRYNNPVYGTPEQRSQVAAEHFQPFRHALALLAEK